MFELLQAAYLLVWLMFLCVDEVVNLKFESIKIIPGERVLIFAEWFVSLQPLILSGAYLSVALKTRKTAQTGVLHTWKLHANDYNVKICPLCAMIRLAMLYGEGIELSGPLFLRVCSTGAVMQPMPVVCDSPCQGTT
jgi:hypothetical protein